MKKKTHLFIQFAIVLIITVFAMRWAYHLGKQEVKLENLCNKVELKGWGADYEKGYNYKIYACTIMGKANFKEDFEPEGDWDICDSEGKNCRPAARDGKWLEEK